MGSKKHINETSPEEVQRYFGDVFLGNRFDVAKLQQKDQESNTEFESALRDTLMKWLGSPSDTSANHLYANFELLKYAAKFFPKALKPLGRTGSKLYRGLALESEALTTLLLRTDPNDWEYDTKNMMYRCKNPIKYEPRRIIQSWSSHKRVAKKFKGFALLETTLNDEFLFNQHFMNLLYAQTPEYETLHFGNTYKDKVYIMIDKSKYDALTMSIGLNKFAEKSVTTKAEVEQILKSLYVKLKSYTIHSDLTVDVNDSVIFSRHPFNLRLQKLPIKFGIVYGYFHCSNIGLTTLENSPKQVLGSFACSGNKLTSLKGGPEWVDGIYDCTNNDLQDFKGSPKSAKAIDARRNNIRSLEGLPENATYEIWLSKDTEDTIKNDPNFEKYNIQFLSY